MRTQALESSALADVDPPSAEPFEQLFEAERGRLFRALCLLTGSRDEAEEIAQDAFVRIWERWDRVGSMDDPTGYLFRTALNTARSRRRRARFALRRQPGDVPSLDALGLVEERHVLALSLGRLTAKQRSAVVLLDALGFSSEEAGTVLGMSPGAVRTQASRARAELRRMTGDDDA